MGVVGRELVTCRIALVPGKYWPFGAGKHVVLFSLVARSSRTVCSPIKQRLSGHEVVKLRTGAKWTHAGLIARITVKTEYC